MGPLNPHITLRVNKEVLINSSIFSKCNGYMLPETFFTNNENINDLNSKWYCLECKSDLYTHTIESTLQKIGQQLSELPKGSVDACKQFLKLNEPYLHNNHHYVVDIKLALVQLLGQKFTNGIPDITDEDLLIKIKYCRDLIDLTNKLIPGLYVKFSFFKR